VPGAGTFSFTGESWVFWNKPSLDISACFDYYRLNPAWIYVACKDEIMQSVDGGMSWASWGPTEVNDLLVDPQLGGLLYGWTRTGSLYRLVAGVPYGSALDTETPLRQPRRIARCFHNSNLYTITGGKVRQSSVGGGWTDVDTGLSDAGGLRMFGGEQLTYVAGALYTSDAGDTPVDKTGDMSDPTIALHLFKAAA
jgi:hypothetical protein